VRLLLLGEAHATRDEGDPGGWGRGRVYIARIPSGIRTRDPGGGSRPKQGLRSASRAACSTLQIQPLIQPGDGPYATRISPRNSCFQKVSWPAGATSPLGSGGHLESERQRPVCRQVISAHASRRRDHRGLLAPGRNHSRRGRKISPYARARAREGPTFRTCSAAKIRGPDLLKRVTCGVVAALLRPGRRARGCRGAPTRTP
jgi:hypothetical protein